MSEEQRDLDAYLIRSVDVIRRLNASLETTEERFWKLLGREIDALVREHLPGDMTCTFEIDLVKQQLGSAYAEEWVLLPDEKEPGQGGPGLWLPEDQSKNGVDELYSLLGVSEGDPVYATAWGTPVSRFLIDLESARRLWSETVGSRLIERGWESYGDRTRHPRGDWGTRIPLQLDRELLADAIRAGDLRAALGPIEKVLEDFAFVHEAIGELVTRVRERQQA